MLLPTPYVLLSGPVVLLTGHRKSGFLSPISPTSSRSPSLETVMMHTTTTVFKKIKSANLIFTLYKRQRKSDREETKSLEAMYWFYTNAWITNWMCLVPAQLEQREIAQTNNHN